MSQSSDNVIIIETDGCTGFPDQVGSKDLTHCCKIHDIGGPYTEVSDAVLQKCLNDLDPGALWWVVIVAIGVGIMKILRPIYNLFQKWGWLPKTPASNF